MPCNSSTALEPICSSKHTGQAGGGAGCGVRSSSGCKGNLAGRTEPTPSPVPQNRTHLQQLVVGKVQLNQLCGMLHQLLRQLAELVGRQAHVGEPPHPLLLPLTDGSAGLQACAIARQSARHRAGLSPQDSKRIAVLTLVRQAPSASHLPLLQHTCQPVVGSPQLAQRHGQHPGRQVRPHRHILQRQAQVTSVLSGKGL
jgi:hypothetical protein